VIASAPQDLSLHRAARRAVRAATVEEQAEQAARALPPLLAAAERIAQTVAFGAHGRRVTGPGDTFWQFRRYGPEDPSTAIDWRQSAKSQHIYVREREWDAAQSVWFWRDASPSMDWRSDPALPTKRERASVLATALASLLARSGERIGLVGADTIASNGRAALRRFAARMAAEGPPGPEIAPNVPIPRHATVVVLGDFFGLAEDFRTMLARFSAAGARGHAMQIVDPAEIEFPFDGHVLFERVDGFDAALLGRAESARAEYRRRFDAHTAQLARIARGFGWSFAQASTARAPEHALLQLHTRLAEDPRRAGTRVRA
jgi:uncharacterized protein (DUF58 family)